MDEYQRLVRSIILQLERERVRKGWSKKEVSLRMSRNDDAYSHLLGWATMSDLSKKSSVSVSTLFKVAKALDLQLKISFEDKKKAT